MTFFVMAKGEKEYLERLKTLESFYLKQMQAAHDIRSPICALEVIIEEIKLPSIYANPLRLSIKRIREIAQDILNYQENLIEKEKTLVELIEEIINEKKLEWKLKNAKVSLFIEKAAYNKFIPASNSDFKRVFSNILNNAHEAIASNGVINIKVSIKNNYFVLDIIDNGCGINEAIKSRLCEQGVSYGKKSGNGLGLHYANRKIKEWGGALHIESHSNFGTRVTIYLKASNHPLSYL